RLAAARFADQPDSLALVQGHAEVHHRRDLAGAGEVGDAEVAAFQHRRPGGLALVAHGVVPPGQSLREISRSASASRLKPSTSEDRARQGKRVPCGAGCAICTAPAFVLPQSGSGGATPRPSKPTTTLVITV